MSKRRKHSQSLGQKDVFFMKEALKLAESVRGRTSPDPMVGAVIVKSGKIISKGYHAEVRTPHAESFAIRKAGKRARGATLYLNLEPCCHFGNNPPCTERIIESGIKRVVAAMKDPNPLVRGKGFTELRRAGIKVDVGVLGKEAKKLNEAFIKHITTQSPFVILKTAMTLDGKIATEGGQSKWMSGEAARGFVHQLRNSVDAVLVGKNTVAVDDPLLTVRGVKNKIKDPLRIIIDGKAEIPVTSKVLSREPQNTIVVVSRKAPKDRVLKIRAKGVEVLEIPEKAGGIDLKKLMKELGRRNVISLLIEGGGATNASALSQGIVDKIYFFVAPKIVGGKESLTPVEGKGIKSLKKALKVREFKAEIIGEDILLEGYLY